MAKIISASIDLSKIDKNRIHPGKTGAKYYNIQVIINDEKDDYGNDCYIIENQTKEEREAKAKKKYLGNGKTVWESPSKDQEHQAEEQKPYTDDLPF